LVLETQASHVNATDKSDNTFILQAFPLKDLSYKLYSPEAFRYTAPLNQILKWSWIPCLQKTEQLGRHQQSYADLLLLWIWHLM